MTVVSISVLVWVGMVCISMFVWVGMVCISVFVWVGVKRDRGLKLKLIYFFNVMKTVCSDTELEIHQEC